MDRQTQTVEPRRRGEERPRRDRRGFLVAIGAGLIARSNPGRAQPAPKIFRIGFLEAGAASVNRHFLDSFTAGLRELGYTPGGNIVVIDRWAEGRAERFPELLGD